MSNNALSTGEFYWLTSESFPLDYEWWKIYEESFPLAERDTKEQLKFVLNKNIARIGGYRINKELVGIVVFYRMQIPAFAFLHYFAIAPAWRGKNYGTHLFKSIITEANHFVLQQSDKNLGLFWEVEDPSAAHTEAEMKMQTKRIHFYQRLGGELFQSKFIQPSLNNQPQVAMQLMHKCDKGDLNEFAIAKAIYIEKYAIINDVSNQQIEYFLSDCFPRLKVS